MTHDEQSTAGMYIQNAGVGAAGSFAVSFSGECDTYSFTNPPHRIEGLAPGAEDFYSVKFSFPAGETNCYVRAAIDQDNAVVESDESNNTVSVRVTVQ